MYLHRNRHAVTAKNKDTTAEQIMQSFHLCTQVKTYIYSGCISVSDQAVLIPTA